MCTRVFSGLIIGALMFSCEDKRKDINDITAMTQDTTRVNTVEVLTVEDIQRLQSESEAPFLSYDAVISPSIEKIYPFTADTGDIVKCILNSNNPAVSLSLYKLMIKTVKLDSVTEMKVKDYTFLKSGDSIQDISKKPSSYKAIVRMIKSDLQEDSIGSFRLQIFRSKATDVQK